MYAKVIVNEKSKFTDTFYTYTLNDENLKVGDRVVVPFGKKNIEGYIFEFTDSTDLPEEKIKQIISKCNYLCLNEEIVKTCIWMKSRYGIKYYDAINLFIPSGKPVKEEKKKVPYRDVDLIESGKVELTLEQKNAVNRINESIDKNENKIFLIHGVTSSGKTEVYMEAIKKALNMGKTSIMLVPEISLTSQTIERFAGRFGKENIAVLHSKLTKRERFDEWERLRNGKAKIAIGARMGVFSPLDNVGVIILDEEHEGTYKSDMSPKYDTAEVAAKRMMNTNGVLILGSATPSVSSYERAKNGIYELIELKERYNKTPLPLIDIVDMRKEIKKGNTSLLSTKLYSLIDENLKASKQVIILQNRRGYSNYLSCMECGNVITCNRCGISLTYHKSNNSLVCHYCGKKVSVYKECPECKSKYLKFKGVGTEQVEETLSNLFKDKVIKRLDLDVSLKRTEMDMILKDFRNRKIDILVGTQLVAKGLDFDNVGLVGVINADTTLNIPDYRSSERTFQLLTQVAGRAGRGLEQGKVLIQTTNPENYIFKAIKEYSYNSFFMKERDMREALTYPPFGDLIVCNFTSKKEEIANDVALRCSKYMTNALENKNAEVFLPKVSYNFKGSDSYRTYILVKSSKELRNECVYYLDEFSKLIFNEKINCSVNIDVNPYSNF